MPRRGKKEELSLKKSRFFMLHPACNQRKIEALEDLHTEYVVYSMPDIVEKLNLTRYRAKLVAAA